MFEKKKIKSFDLSRSVEIFIKNSERHKDLEDDSRSVENLITVGSCYSYVAAAFKENSLSIDIKKFNRILFSNNIPLPKNFESDVKFNVFQE